MEKIQSAFSETSIAWRTMLPRVGYGLGWLLVLWIGLCAAILADFQPRTPLNQGAVSNRDVRAPERLTYRSEVRTQRERERQANAVSAIFSPPDRSQAILQTSTAASVAGYIAAVRADSYADDEEKLAYVAALQPVQFGADSARLLLALPDDEWGEVVGETQRLIDATMRGEITETRLPTVLRNLPTQISIALSDGQVQVVREWVGALITPNTALDSARTEQAREEARAAVAPIEVTLEAGQIVVREGELVTAEQVEALQALGLQSVGRAPSFLAATALLLLLLVGAIIFYLLRVHPDHYNSPRAMWMIVVLLLTVSLGARLVMPDHLLLTYLFPTSVAAMLLGVLLGADIALLVTVTLALIVGLLTNSIEMVSYTFVGGLLSSLLLWRVERLGTFVRAGALVGLAQLLVLVAFSLRDGGPLQWAELAATGGVALLNGAASASLALAGFYMLSSFLGTTTFLQLMELARPTTPLFRELLLKAPGTYHHVIVVSNLAERAAEAIGADMLLVRVGAYYHDVGKLHNPHYFVENQADGVNLHDALDDPQRSAQIIVAHVTEGVKLARRHKLPRRIIQFIAEHHGTTNVAYFYRKACDRYGAAQVDATTFRYPGPKPQSRESAILMLADSVEATARAIKPAGKDEIDALIRKTVAAKLGEGQLDECELNLRDLDIIRQSFVEVLQGIYHPRIQYPDAKSAPQSAPPALPAPSEAPHDSPQPHPNRDRSAVGSPR